MSAWLVARLASLVLRDEKESSDQRWTGGFTKVGAFVRLARPKFLVYSWVLCSLGATAAFLDGRPFDWKWYVVGLCTIWCAHLTTHLSNEYFDQAADAANLSPTRWTGGSRVLVDGALKPESALSSAFILLFTSTALTIALPAPARYYGFGAVALGWFYTAPPFRLNYRGFGEITVAIVLTILAPVFSFAVQRGNDFGPLILLMVPSFIVQCVRMMMMNLADYDGDRQVGKYTSVVLLGPKRAAVVHAAGQALAYSIAIVGGAAGVFPRGAAIAIALTAPIAIWQSVRVLNGASMRGAANNVAFVASTHVALVIAATYAGLLVERDGSFEHIALWAPLAVLGVIIAGQIRSEVRARQST